MTTNLSYEIEVNTEHLNRWQRDASYYADEPVTVEKVNDVLYAYGSELACRRIEHTFRHSINKTTLGYSKNLETWFFGLRIN